MPGDMAVNAAADAHSRECMARAEAARQDANRAEAAAKAIKQQSTQSRPQD